MHAVFASAGSNPKIAQNRFGVDYRRAAAALGEPVVPIVDSHAHVNGPASAAIFREVMDLFGVREVRSMTRRPDALRVRSALGDRVKFIAFPDFRAPDRVKAFCEGYLDDIRWFREELGAAMIKLWNAPRLLELFPGDAGREFVPFDSPWRVKHVELAQSLGMSIMVHVADPDTWFATRYADAGKFMTKPRHYEALERMMDRYPGPWIAAHMGGYPESLDFLDGLLERHPNLSIDTSATKWVVRELSKHQPRRVRDFFRRWRGRIRFGSDIVTLDEHLTPAPDVTHEPRHTMADLADSPDSAFQLYASRYLALRLLLETNYDGQSPIEDPDLAMVGEVGPPWLRGFGLEPRFLREIYTNPGSDNNGIAS
jgi:hypothetical protein